MKKTIAIILTILTSFSVLTGCGSKTVTIDLSDYLNALYSGSDGTGKARGDFDYFGFEDAVMAGARSDQFNLGKMIQLESNMVITVNPDCDLKNGDKVTVTATYDKGAAKNAGIKITGNTKTFIVEGLRNKETADNSRDIETAESLFSSDTADEAAAMPSSIELDAFDPAYWDTPNGILISYSGTAPYGTLEIYNNLPAENPLSKVGYSFSECRNVHVGDPVTVTPYFTIYEMKEDYYFKEMTTTYIVGNVDHYLTDAAELDSITIASMKQTVQGHAENSITGFLEFQTESDYKGFYNGETVTLQSCQAGNSAYTLRNEDGFIEAIAIPCYMNVTVQEPDWMENAQTYQYDLVFVSTFSNIIVHADGSVTMDDAWDYPLGTASMENEIMANLKSSFASPVMESVEFAG